MHTLLEKTQTRMTTSSRWLGNNLEMSTRGSAETGSWDRRGPTRENSNVPSTSSRKGKGLMSFFSHSKSTRHPELIDVDSPRRPDVNQPSVHQTTLAVANNPYYKPMFDEACRAGLGVTPPSAYQLLNSELQKLKAECKLYIDHMKIKWSTYGVIVMCDSWTGPTRQCLMNFMVYCDGLMTFDSSVDLSKHKKDHRHLLKHMRRVVDKVGKENVVQIVTDNGANFKKAGEMLARENVDNDSDCPIFDWIGDRERTPEALLDESGHPNSYIAEQSGVPIDGNWEPVPNPNPEDNFEAAQSPNDTQLDGETYYDPDVWRMPSDGEHDNAYNVVDDDNDSDDDDHAQVRASGHSRGGGGGCGDCSGPSRVGGGGPPGFDDDHAQVRASGPSRGGGGDRGDGSGPSRVGGGGPLGFDDDHAQVRASGQSRGGGGGRGDGSGPSRVGGGGPPGFDSNQQPRVSIGGGVGSQRVTAPRSQQSRGGSSKQQSRGGSSMQQSRGGSSQQSRGGSSQRPPSGRGGCTIVGSQQATGGSSQ
ncbi:hypothetical protein IFM89_026930 [Coptis chinensis]|uniref:DUF659 domain-containing protein n=1 Tax=Coptis chinensis TaxID=261450 RepID=A0A835LCQ1_9MAGN|nr:hypothetical protein IFM89_026930 [Coptis chinensis]